MTRSPLPILTSLLVLGACGKGTGASDFAEVEFSEFESWGRGLDDFGGSAGGGASDSGLGGGSGGGGSTAHDGTWQGTYTFFAELTDYGYTCECTSDLTLGIVEGSLQVGQGGICNMDCGINTRLEFDGTIGETGAAAGAVTESTSFFFSTSWVGTFSETSASGTFSDTVSTDQGAANVSGSFSVAPL